MSYKVFPSSYPDYVNLFKQALIETGAFSPDSKMVNAKLTFPPSGGELVQNLAGNWVPAQGDPIIINAVLRSDGRPKADYYPGANTDEEPMHGRSCDPILLPENLVSDAEADAIINNVNGKFRLVRVLRSPYSAAAVVGDRIEGLFRRVRGY